MTFPRGGAFDEIVPDWDRLAYASRGAMRVSSLEGMWVVPPHRGLWLPAGTRHRVHMSGTVSLRTVYFWPFLSRRLPREPRVMNVSPLLRELLHHVTARGTRGTLDAKTPRDRHVIGLLLEELRAVDEARLQLPFPRDERAARAAARLTTDAGLREPLPGVARRAGASLRTLQRLFAAETGLTLEAWRLRARLLRAVEHLAGGRAVTAVAIDVGYESPSAFIAAFRRELGETPGRFLRGSSS